MNEQATPKPTNGVQVNIGGTDFTLRYPLAAMRQAKEHFGGSITSAEVLHRIPVEDLGTLLLFGLREHHPDLTIEKLEELIDPTQVKYLFGKYREALGAALPEADPNAQSPAAMLAILQDIMSRAEALQKAISIGSNSGQSDATTSDSQNANSGA